MLERTSAPKTIKQRGFTIVELLIVIVVIAVLAAITVVAFNGIQTRATNSRIQSVAANWAKALRTYRIENGSYPAVWTCLGEGYKYGSTGTDTSGVGQCRQDDAVWGVVEDAAFKTSVRKYFNGGALPTPDFITAAASTTSWIRGIMFTSVGGAGTEEYMLVVYKGALTQCPAITGVAGGSLAVVGGNTRCQYNIGVRTDMP